MRGYDTILISMLSWQRNDLISTPSRSEIWRQAPQHLLPPGFLTDVVGPFRERLVLSELELEFVTWSAIYHCHDDLAFWSAKYGIDKSRETVLSKVKSDDPRFRQGAAFAAGRILRSDEEASTLVFTLSIDDPDPKVRREAGAASCPDGMSEDRGESAQGIE